MTLSASRQAERATDESARGFSPLARAASGGMHEQAVAPIGAPATASVGIAHPTPLSYTQQVACEFEDARQRLLADPANATKLTEFYEASRRLAHVVAPEILATIPAEYAAEAIAA